MQKTIASIALTALALLTTAASPRNGHHIKASLEPVPDSTVTGFVQLVQLPHGGTNIHVIARGLDPGVDYAAFYYASSDCTGTGTQIGPDFSGLPSGTGHTHAKVEADLADIGSVGVRLGPGEGDLRACAVVH